MNQNTPMIYSTHARWYVSTTRAVDRRGRLRCALLIRSPHHDELLYIDLPRGDETACTQRAARLVADLYDSALWYRRPLQVRCNTVEFTKAVTPLLSHDTHVRTDSQARCFRAAEQEFKEYVLAQGFASR